MNDAFSKCHPAVNFLFFAGAIAAAVVIQHPAYLLATVLTGMIYYFLLNGRKGIKLLLGLLPLFILLTAVNPLFNTLGDRALFFVFGRPYTAQALFYGAAVGAMFVGMVLWFGCYNKVLTTDKFTSLFGYLIPSISLLLVMVLRMIPAFIRKARQILGARQAIGKGLGDGATKKEKVTEGMTVLGALTAWALEGSIITADSMRARGYSGGKRSSFMTYPMTARDYTLLILMGALLALLILSAFQGQTEAVFVPTLQLAAPSWGLGVYTIYLLIPTILHIKEVLAWRISRSKI